MDNKVRVVKRLIHFFSKRNIVQFIATLFTNIHLPNFLKGTMYTGNTKVVCVPGLNCYSCPGAAGACPVGAFQAVVGSSKYKFSYYISGILILFGVLLGRFVCGFLCPFGWFQDLLHKIPFKKFSTKKLKPLRYLKYFILLVTVWILPAVLVNEVGMGTPYFCKYICPQGILEGGIPLSLANKGIAAALGILFKFKLTILVCIIILSMMFYRPFCKWICPLGAFYSFFNKVSFLNYYVNDEKCVSCAKCSKICKMDVDITKSTKHLECIRCGECVAACPTKAISIKWAINEDEKIGEKNEKNISNDDCIGNGSFNNSVWK